MLALAERTGAHIEIRTTVPTAKLGDTVSGARFRKKPEPHWRAPLDMRTCYALREKFGEALVIGPELWGWAAVAKVEREHLVALTSAEDASLTRLASKAPRLAEAMGHRTYQRVAARFIADGRRVIIGDEPGLGKTLEAMAGVIESGEPGPHLIITPKTAVDSVWAREIPRWISGQRVITLPDGKATREGILESLSLDQRLVPDDLNNTWLIINPEVTRTRSLWVCRTCKRETPRRAGNVKLACGHNPHRDGYKTRDDHDFPALFAIEFGSIIADECEKMLMRPRGLPTQKRRGMECLRWRQDGKGVRVAMSGTPFRGNPLNMWSLLNWLMPEIYTAYWKWAGLYFPVSVNAHGGYEVGALDPSREAALWQSVSSVLLRRTKGEVAADLPPKAYVGTPIDTADPHSPYGVWLPMSPAQRRAYEQMKARAIAEVEGGNVEANGVLAELIRLKQFASTYGEMVERMVTDKDSLTGKPRRVKRLVFTPSLPSNKFDYVVELLTELGYPEQPLSKVVIASQFTQTLELYRDELPKALGIKPEHITMITGEVTGKRRTAAIDSMNQPNGTGAQVCLINTKAGGVAISLDYADTMVILDKTWIADDQIQLEDRIHRVSRPRPVTYHYLMSEGTIDEDIVRLNLDQERNTLRLLDGRRGVSTARKLLGLSNGDSQTERENEMPRPTKIVLDDNGNPDYSAYLDADPTEMQAAYTEWLISALGLEVKGQAAKAFALGVKLSVAMRSIYTNVTKAEAAEETPEPETPAKAPKKSGKAKAAPEPEDTTEPEPKKGKKDKGKKDKPEKAGKGKKADATPEAPAEVVKPVKKAPGKRAPGKREAVF